MSYHRVLPPLPPHSDTAKGVVEQDTLLRHKIMQTQSSNAIIDRTQNLTLESSLSPISEIEPASSSEDSVEGSVDSPNIQTQSSSQSTSNRGDERLETPARTIATAGPVSWHGESPSQICLCQPDPKVPRPRNAFILYRQHHQAAVVAQNPGLANPEISKVIGDLWRHSTEEIKGHWKDLAEEEKIRHQKQYPDYRYQPRRGGRNNSLSNTLRSTGSGEAETRRCPKCGGRSITTSTHIMPDTGHLSKSPPVGSLVSPNQPPSTPSTGSSAHRFLHNLDSPQLNGSFGYRSRPTTSSSVAANMNGLQIISPRFKRPDLTDFPQSPDPKRRRPNGPYPIRAHNGQVSPFPYPQRRRESLPRPDFMPSHHNGSFEMRPPPRPHHPDSSLTLPPLQTSSAALDSAASAQAKSLEAMVLSIPILNKIRVLAKISPPLSPPGPTSPIQQTRGFVIGIDGSDPATVSQITNVLSTSLMAHHPVRIFHGPEPPRARGSVPKNESSAGDDFPSYLSIISQYHSLSDEIRSYITSVPTQVPSGSPPPTSPVSPKTMPMTKPVTRSTASQQKQQESVSRAASPSPPTGVPIALLPSFQLSHTDAAASRIPITDEYAPVDHWQWMATLWRGVVGPDVTIAVAPNLPMSATSTTSEGKSSNGNFGFKSGGAEVRLDDARAIVVRADGRGNVLEGVLRRVGFEVSEWICSKEEGRRNS
ncbi:hypothetical protein MMC07_002834 [Pseudocyphellaria aurata]|nr:hypothetical protein [Pseudocyphellaria aurata]